MISVIKKGHVPDDREKLTCTRCGCVFSYTREDVKADDRPCAMPYVLCPMEGCDTRVETMNK